MELSEQKLVSAFAQKISKFRDRDPLTLAEILVERLRDMMSDADAGSDIHPVQIVAGGPVDEPPADRPRRESSRPIRESRETKAPPVPESTIITEVDEQAYVQAVESADPRIRGAAPKPKPARPGRVSNLVHAGAPSGAAVEFWTVEDLVTAITENTPSEFYFVPNGCDASVRVLAKRNVQPIIMTQGPSIVRLEYSNPGVSSDRSSTDSAGQLDEVVLGLVATKTFTLDSGDLNIEAAMDSIEEQMKGLFAPRAAQSEPMGRDPGPIGSMFNMNDPKRRTPMGENHEIQGTSGWRQSDPGSVKASVIETNKRYGNR